MERLLTYEEAEAALEGFAARARSAKRPSVILSILDEAEVFDHDQYGGGVLRLPACSVVLEAASSSNRQVLKRAWALGAEASASLLRNPVLDAKAGRWLIEGALGQVERGAGAFKGRRNEMWRVLAAAFEAGMLEEGDPVSEKLEGILRQEHKDVGAYPTILRSSAASALVHSPRVHDETLFMCARVFLAKNDVLLLKRAIQHPNATLPFWRKAAALIVEGGDGATSLAQLLAEMSEARRDLGVRRYLYKQRLSVPVFTLLCLDAGKAAKGMLERLVEVAPHRFCDVLRHPEFESLRELDPSDFIAFLEHPSPEVRMAAILATSRMQRWQMEAEIERKTGEKVPLATGRSIV